MQAFFTDNISLIHNIKTIRNFTLTETKNLFLSDKSYLIQEIGKNQILFRYMPTLRSFPTGYLLKTYYSQNSSDKAETYILEIIQENSKVFYGIISQDKQVIQELRLPTIVSTNMLQHCIDKIMLELSKHK